ncbi:MAG: hypothetical protein ACKOB3_03955 [Holophagaceae bacterium]
MTRSLIDRQSELPRSIPLVRYTPDRVPFSWEDWDPTLVRSADDLPQYLILGDLDPSTFEQSTAGWSARWGGMDTHLYVAYKAETQQCEIRQTWCGLVGGFVVFPARTPLDKVICPGRFPSNWDREAKAKLESRFQQMTVIEQPENFFNMSGIPDGAYRTIVFPLAVGDLRLVQQYIQFVVDESPPSYPIMVDAKLVFQGINYFEGKAPEWTSDEVVVFSKSVAETGLVPFGLPKREVLNDGSATWTLAREIYFLFIRLPFTGLTRFMDVLVLLNLHGLFNSNSRRNLRFEQWPIVMPSAFELRDVELFDEAGTTRSFLSFTSRSPNVEAVAEAERLAPASLAKAEAISSDVLKALLN